MSNRDIQPFRFACPRCGEGIEIVISESDGVVIKGAVTEEFEGFFDGQNPFVDLHLDFPVSFKKYVMGDTPFFQALSLIGHENYQFHNVRIDALNKLYLKVDDLTRIIRLYSRDNDLFSKYCRKLFDEDVKSKEQKDINLALYCILAKVFFPFNYPNDNAESVTLYLGIMTDLFNSDKSSFDSFIKEIIESGFLKNLQLDCLEIYPQILKAELPLRPALFLDFVQRGGHELTSLRVSVDEFNVYKDLYKDISEIMSRQIVLVAGINNLIHRGDHNEFKYIGKDTPKNLNKYADVPYGLKLSHLDDCWYHVEKEVADNQLRNSIAHYKAEYEEVSQIIRYYPRKEGIKQEGEEKIYFLDFMRKILLSYREMHKMHQLVKCLFNYYFIIYTKNEAC